MSGIPIVIMASGRGSNFVAIAEAVASGRLGAEIVGVVSDHAEALVLERARDFGIKSVAVPKEKNETRAAHEAQILSAIKEWKKPQFLVLAGYMRVLSEEWIRKFDSGKGYSRIVNIHPSLLPAFPGVGSYQKAFDAGVQVTGVTVHLVSEKVDAGLICAQEAFSIAGCATGAEVEALGLSVEHRIFVKALSWVLPEKFRIEGSARVRPS